MTDIAYVTQRLIHHRRLVFDPITGDRHHAAILRLKAGEPFQRMLQDNEDAAAVRLSERLTRQGY